MTNTINTATAFRMPFGINLDRNRPRKMVFYGRVSTEHEAQLDAFENQIQWYDDVATRHQNWTVLEKYLDRGITGTQAKKRPAFLQMLEDARQGKFDLIVTREVCRFARNTVDTLVATRELKNLGVEVYFVDDNIWTMDNDGELRLTLMATLAQDESRKISERVKAGQKISRDNGVTYGNGNIMGYDRADGSYIINPEQGETVRMIFDMYLNTDMGCTKIANRLSELRRKNASGVVKWTAGIISRIIRNPTYMGYNVYNQSFSNNYLEQRRILNLDKSSFQLVKADFEPLISEDDWRQCEKKRISRRAPTMNPSPGGRTTHAKLESKDVWQRKLRCECGFALRKNRWHNNKSKKATFGYQCYNQLNNGSAKKRKEQGLDDSGYCDISMIADWKMEAMGKLVMATLWGERRQSVQFACRMIRENICEEPIKPDNKLNLQLTISRVQGKIEKLIEMRTEGEISKEEFLKQRSKLDGELQALDAELNTEPKTPPVSKTSQSAWETIEQTLNRLIDFSQPKLDDKIYEKFVSQVIPRNNNRYAWIMNLGNAATEEFTLVTEGRKTSQKISMEDPEGDDPSLHIDNVIYLSDFVFMGKTKLSYYEKFPPRRLYTAGRTERKLSTDNLQGRSRLYFEFNINYEMAKAFRKATGSHLREFQWQDTTVEVYI